MGFPHCAGQYRPEGHEFVPGLSCRCVGGLLIWGWDLIPGWRWLYTLQRRSNESVGFGFSTPCGAISTLEPTIFVPRLSELQGAINQLG